MVWALPSQVACTREDGWPSTSAVSTMRTSTTPPTWRRDAAYASVSAASAPVTTTSALAVSPPNRSATVSAATRLGESAGSTRSSTEPQTAPRTGDASSSSTDTLVTR